MSGHTCERPRGRGPFGQFLSTEQPCKSRIEEQEGRAEGQTLYSGWMLVQQTTMPLKGSAGSMEIGSSSIDLGDSMSPWHVVIEQPVNQWQPRAWELLPAAID